MIKVVILGAGNVAKHLYKAFSYQNSIKIVQCYNRQGLKIHKDQERNSITNDLNDLVIADVYILAISDDAIQDVSKNLPFHNRLVVHTSGSVPIESLDNKNYRGVFYPLQTFSATKEVIYSDIPFCIEADQPKDNTLLKQMAATLSKMIYDISSEQRNALHVAAVFVNNFTNYMFSIGHNLCKESNIPFEILHPLIQETAKKIVDISPYGAQTGPAVRNDVKTIERHLSILKDNSQKEIYTTLTKAIQSHYGKEL